MSHMPGCDPLAVGPLDVEWDPTKKRAFVLAADGTNPSCGGGFAVGPNHVIGFATAQIPGWIGPEVYTHAFGSGITGTNGDLAYVHADFAFVTPYGADCFGGTPSGVALDAVQLPVVGFPLLTLELSSAPPTSPAVLVVGYDPLDLPVTGGCLLLVSPTYLVALGSTTSAGEAAADVPVPPGFPAGTDVFFQGAVAAGASWSLSQGLQVHVGLK
ncbi:MAG: hypothetical protein AAF682_16770 [Planctomycetota bacterium]